MFVQISSMLKFFCTLLCLQCSPHAKHGIHCSHCHRQNIKVPLEDVAGISDSTIVDFRPFKIVFLILRLFQVLHHGTLGIEDLNYMSQVKHLVVKSHRPLSLCWKTEASLISGIRNCVCSVSSASAASFLLRSPLPACTLWIHFACAFLHQVVCPSGPWHRYIVYMAHWLGGCTLGFPYQLILRHDTCVLLLSPGCFPVGYSHPLFPLCLQEILWQHETSHCCQLRGCLAVKDSGMLCHFADGTFVCFPLAGHKCVVSLLSAPPPHPHPSASLLWHLRCWFFLFLLWPFWSFCCTLSVRGLSSDCRKVCGLKTGGSWSATEGFISGVPAPSVFPLWLCCFSWWLVSLSLCAASSVRFLEFLPGMLSNRKALVQQS